MSEAIDNRRPLLAIGLVSAAAVGFLFWLIYFNEAGAAPEAVAKLPAVNATLNGLSAVFLTIGWVQIRRRHLQAHRNLMLAAFVTSSLFLVSYIVYHTYHGDSSFQGQGLVRPIYFLILISHIVLSVVVLPLIFTTFFFSLSGQFRRHRALARWTLPMWLYVSVTGVLVFAFLKIFGSAPA